MARRPAVTPRKQAIQSRSRATVDALVEATARILVSEGYDKASTNRIAEVAGVSVGSLYQYFPGKEALVLAVIERHNRDIMDVVGKVLAELDLLPIDQAVRRLVTAAVAAHRVDPQLHFVLSEQVPRTGALEHVEAVNQQAHRAFAAYLESRRHELGVGDVTLAAFICATSIEALAHNAVLHNAGLSSDRSVQALIDETTRLLVTFLKGGDEPARALPAMA